MGWNSISRSEFPCGQDHGIFIEKSDAFIQERPWVKNLYFTGIVVLVMMPVMGSGGIRGTIIGNLLGMQKIPLFLAIVTGAFIGCFGIALAAVFLQELFIKSILLGTAAVVVIIIITLIGWNYWKGYQKRIHP